MENTLSLKGQLPRAMGLRGLRSPRPLKLLGQERLGLSLRGVASSQYPSHKTPLRVTSQVARAAGEAVP